MKIGIVLETRPEDAQHGRFVIALVALRTPFLGISTNIVALA